MKANIVLFGLGCVVAIAPSLFAQHSSAVRPKEYKVVTRLQDEEFSRDNAAGGKNVPVTQVQELRAQGQSLASQGRPLPVKSARDRARELGFDPDAHEKRDPCVCPLCAEDFKLPCGKCESCKGGFPCQLAPCRHCVQPLDINAPNFCDLTAGDEPCGTCDACMEHRSAPCEHAGSGFGPKGEFNPYHQNPMFAAPSRLWTGHFNNGAHRFPIYYNPAPYYRPTWNPAMFGGYQRPFTFRWTSDYAHYDPNQDTTGARAGQVAFGYNCKFCGRTPCACVADICDVNKPMKPDDIKKAIQNLKDQAEGETTTLEKMDEMSLPGETRRPSPVSSLLDEDVPTELEAN